MSKTTIMPYGPHHPVLPEPIHLDLELEDERVVNAIPQLGFIHRGLEGLVTKRDYNQLVYIAERICGICAVGHSMGYCEAVEELFDVTPPVRAQILRTILHELSRIHSHLLWAGLGADAFGFEALFMHAWRLREEVLEFFERTTGGRVILSFVKPGGIKHDISDEDLADLRRMLTELRPQVEGIVGAFLDDNSVAERTKGVGILTYDEAIDVCAVGPFARASGVDYDIRNLRNNGYAYLDSFTSVLSHGCDCYARMEVRLLEVLQSMDIVLELLDKLEPGEIMQPIKGKPEKGKRSMVRIEQPRGEAYYYLESNGTKFLERMRVRTPTATNVPGMVQALKGCQLADVSMIFLTIDPCISCTER